MFLYKGKTKLTGILANAQIIRYLKDQLLDQNKTASK